MSQISQECSQVNCDNEEISDQITKSLFKIVAFHFESIDIRARWFVRLSDGPRRCPRPSTRSCADQLVEVFTDIFNLSLLQAEVLSCFKKTTIIPVPKKTHAMCLNDCRPIALTSIIMKCFERLVMAHINAGLQPASIPFSLPTDIT
eukprot:g40179.t1